MLIGVKYVFGRWWGALRGGMSVQPDYILYGEMGERSVEACINHVVKILTKETLIMGCLTILKRQFFFSFFDK